MAIKMNPETYDNASDILLSTESKLNKVVSEITLVSNNLDSKIASYVSRDLNKLADNIDDINYNSHNMSKKISEKAEEFRSIEKRTGSTLKTISTLGGIALGSGAGIIGAGVGAVVANKAGKSLVENTDIAHATASIVTEATSTVADLFTAAKNTIGNVINDIGDAISNTAATVVTKAKSAFDWIADKAKSIGNTVYNAVSDAGAKVVNKAKSAVDWVVDKAKAVGSFTWHAITHPIETLKKTGASIANTAVALVQGLAEFGEALLDTATIIGTALNTPIYALLDGFQWIGGKITGNEDWNSLTKEAWDKTMAFVSTKYVTNAFDSFYQNNAIGKWLDENAYAPFKSTGAIYKVADGVGYIGGILLLTLATCGVGGAAAGAGAAGTGAAAGAGTSAGVIATYNIGNVATISITQQALTSGAIAATAGFGKNTQNAWADGASLTEGLAYGTAMAAWEGGEMILGAGINTLKFPGLTGFKGQLLTTGSHVALDTIDGGSGALVNPLMQMIYNPNEQNMEQIMYLVNYDKNGIQISNKTWDDLSFTEKYQALFEYNGGWGAVGTQALSAGAMSFLTEVPDIKKAYTASKVVGPVGGAVPATIIADEATTGTKSIQENLISDNIPDTKITEIADDLSPQKTALDVADTTTKQVADVSLPTDPAKFIEDLNQKIMNKFNGEKDLLDITIGDYTYNYIRYGKEIADELEVYRNIPVNQKFGAIDIQAKADAATSGTKAITNESLPGDVLDNPTLKPFGTDEPVLKPFGEDPVPAADAATSGTKAIANESLPGDVLDNPALKPFGTDEPVLKPFGENPVSSADAATSGTKAITNESLPGDVLDNPALKPFGTDEPVLKPFGEDPVPSADAATSGTKAIVSEALPESPVLFGNYIPDSTTIISSQTAYDLITKLEHHYNIEVLDIIEGFDVLKGNKQLTEADIIGMIQKQTGIPTDGIYEELTYAVKQIENKEALTKELVALDDKYETATKQISLSDPLANQKYNYLQDTKKLEAELMEIANHKGMTLEEYAKSLGQIDEIDPNLQALAMQKAKELSAKAAQAEPSITQMMKSLEENGATLQGLGYKFKSNDSIARKIVSWAQYGNINEYSINAYGDAINDSLRYTLVLDEASYSSGVYSSLKKLMDNGYQIDGINNLWGKSTYQGLNVTLKDANGVKFEVQFHTESSYLTKETLNHTYYEIARSAGATSQEKYIANQIMQHNQTMNVNTINDMVGLSPQTIVDNAKNFDPSKISSATTLARQYSDYGEFVKQYEAESKAWVNSLTKKEQDLIKGYVGEYILQEGNYKAVNGILRGTIIDPSSKTISWRGTGGYLETWSFNDFEKAYNISVSDFVKLQTQAAEDLNVAISRMTLKERTILTRGVNWDALSTYGIKEGDSAQVIMQKLYASGNIYSDPGFMSASPVPAFITSSKPIQLVMDCDAGTKCADLSHFNSGEKEVLFGAGQKFTIENVTEENNQIKIYLKSI